MDWLDLLAVQGTLKSLLQYHSSQASILQPSAFFTVQLLHPYRTTGKTTALTRRTFVGILIYYIPSLSILLIVTWTLNTNPNKMTIQPHGKMTSWKTHIPTQVWGGWGEEKELNPYPKQ